MKKVRLALFVPLLVFCIAGSALAGVSIGIGLPNVSIGINIPVFPQLVAVPGYPVYYAPQVDANYFFYDVVYWVFQNDNWYTSSWYNGPWALVDPLAVPLPILNVPVSYYRAPPVYFRGWARNAPPRWGQHWGHNWSQNRRGWSKWHPGHAATAAPLPTYQRQYVKDRYPKVEQQHVIRNQQYRYQPHEPVVRQHFQSFPQHGGPGPGGHGGPGGPGGHGGPGGPGGHGGPGEHDHH